MGNELTPDEPDGWIVIAFGRFTRRVETFEYDSENDARRYAAVRENPALSILYVGEAKNLALIPGNYWKEGKQ